MRILVTGGHGLIGRHVVAALSGRAEVIAPGRREVDLLDPAQRRTLVTGARADILIHLAWVTEHGKFWASPDNAAWEAASVDLFRHFYGAGGRRAVATGSCAEYDWTTGTGQFAETASLAPHTAYGAAKVRTAAQLAELAAVDETEWAWARVFFLYGAGEPPGRLVPLILRAALAGEPLGIGPGATERDFMDVRDLGAAIAALALSDLQGSVNVASGSGTSFRDLAAIVERLAGTTGVIRTNQRPLGAGEPARLVADTTRLREGTGFMPRHSLENSLSDYLATLRA